MSHSQSLTLEVTKALLDRARTAQFHFGADTALVAIQHMLLQTVDLFDTAGAMGLNLKNIFALGKVYSNSPPVIETLRDRGVTIIESTTPEPGDFHSSFERDVQTLWQVTAETLAQRSIERILVLDDDGVCITNVPHDVLSNYAVCGVEQTSQGMFLFEDQPPPFAVISWARSAVKLQIGGPVFSQCFIDKLNTEFLYGRSIKGEQLGIIGMGSIGRALAKLAVRQGIKVLFYDPAPDVHIPASLHGIIARTHSLEELMITSDYVAGCSGRNPFQDRWPLNHRPGIKLFSISTGDQEFGPIINDLKARPDFAVDPATWTITSEHGPSGPLEIAYLGYPYTFVSRAPEAVPTQIVQLETGGLLAGLIQAHMFLQTCETCPEHNKNPRRASPEAQRFVYETWLGAMKDHGVSLIETFGYAAEVLSAAHQLDWLSQHSEPHEDALDEIDRTVEKRMTEFVRRD
ncbi:MAG TPA: NAD(P)-dependent oxidoreductase [Pyrinomonadaceae bacterium]|nr:NAD(P)-dependent oxidoreductase [Pyrinomonadaceae bacterium]